VFFGTNRTFLLGLHSFAASRRIEEAIHHSMGEIEQDREHQSVYTRNGHLTAILGNTQKHARGKDEKENRSKHGSHNTMHDLYV
jgi:hypothetical protein